jgi:GT2 family glycosyltransferase/Tfp pilus assembly protein PilF
MDVIKKYLVSAIVPTYDSGRFMRGLLEDLEAQTLADRLEIVIVDTGSPTNEKAIVGEFQKHYDNIVYTRTEHRESSHSAINRGLKTARGKYVTLACTDDRHKKDAFERMVAVLEDRPDVALVYANSYITATENETFEKHTRVGNYRWADFNPMLLYFGCFMGPQPMWRKGVHDKYGYFDESLESAGDWEFWLRMAEGETFLHIDEFLGLYLYSPTSCEHRDPDLSRREAILIQGRYLPWLPKLLGIQKKIIVGEPVISGPLILVRRGAKSKESLNRCVEGLRHSLSNGGDFSIRVVRDHPDIPENELGVKVSPPTPTVTESLQQAIEWEARYVVVVSGDVLLSGLCLDRLIAIADSDTSIAAVGPTSNEATPFQWVKPDYGNLEDDLQAFINRRMAQYRNEWEEVPYLGGFCLLFKTQAIREVGGVNGNLPFADILWDLFHRLKAGGFKLACALEAFVHHVSRGEDEAKAKGSLVKDFIQAHFTWDRAAEVVKKRMIKGMVSIIIPVTIGAKHLKECVQAIRKRSPEPHEILFIDTNSPQDIQKWLKMIARENNNYKIIHTPNSFNPSESFNLGIRESAGEFLVLLNPDVVVTENWLSGLLECLQSARDIGIVGPMTNQISGIQKIEEVGYRSLEGLDEYARLFREKNRYRRIPFRRIVGFCMLFRRELADRIGFLDESFGTGNFEDDDLCLRSELAGFRNLIAGDVFIHHFGSRSFAGNGIDYHSALSGNRKKFDEKWNGVDYKTPEGKKLLLLRARESARQFCSREQIDKAIEKLLAALALEPQDPELHCELAEIFLGAKGFEKAIEVLKQMPAGSQDERKMTLLGYGFEGLGKFEEAEEWAERALSQNAHSAPALNLKGILAYRRQKMEEAAGFFQKAIETDKGYGEPYTNLGLMKWSAGQKEEAVSLFEKGFILAPTIPDQIMNYHAAVTETAQFARAEKYFREAKALHPFHKRVHFLLIDLLLRQGQHAEAMKEIEEAMISFGVDEGILTASLEVRKRIGPKEIPTGKNRNSLSLCMIVKNEEKHLPQCLGSVKDLVDEIVIVDTGSGDKTREISTAFGAKVYEFPWGGDFSAARNFSVGQARGEWILILDADERIAAKDFPDLRELACQKGNRRVAYSFVTRNYTPNSEVQGWTPNEGIYEEEKGIGWFPSEKVRLFPNDSRIRFQGVVHEGVRSSLKDHSVAIEDSSIPIHHFGKLDEQRERKKGEEYYLLGKKKLESSEPDVRNLRELAVQAGELERYAEAAELWNQVITLQPDMAEAYTNLSSLYLKLKKYDQAYAASKQAVILNPDSKEALLNFSTAGLSRGKTFESILTLESLLAKNPEYPPALGVLSLAYVLHGEKEKSSVLIEKLKRWGFNYAEYLSLMSQEFASMGREKEGQMLHQMISQSEALPSPVCEPGLVH